MTDRKRTDSTGHEKRRASDWSQNNTGDIDRSQSKPESLDEFNDQLKRLVNTVASEPIPQRFEDLLKQLSDMEDSSTTDANQDVDPSDDSKPDG